MSLSYNSIAVGLTIGVIAGGAGGALAQDSSSAGASKAHRSANGQTAWQWGAWADSGSDSAWRRNWSWHAGVPNEIATAAATYLGISPASLNRQRHSQTLAQIAKAHGKSAAGLRSMLLATVKKEVEANQASTGAEKSAIESALAGNIGEILNGHCPDGHGTAGWS